MNREAKARRKYRRKFTAYLRGHLRRPWLRVRGWELMSTGEAGARPSWSAFSSGYAPQAAVAPVKYRGRQYWAVATTSTDGEAVLASLFAFNLFGLLLSGPEVFVTLWAEDPRRLDQPISHYYGTSAGPARYHLSVEADRNALKST